jgi:DNA repair exonuclease SbcCD ATPase subunit
VIGSYVVQSQLDVDKTNEFVEAAERSAKAVDDKIAADKREVDELDAAVKKIEELNGLEQLNARQKEEMKLAVDKLNGAYPDLNLQIAENGKLTEESTQKLELNIEALKKQFEIQKKQEEIQTILEQNYELEQQLTEAQEKHKEATERMTEAQEKLNEQTGNYDGMARNLSPAVKEWGDKLADARSEVEDTEEAIDSINGILEENETKLQELSGEVDEASASMQEDTAAVAAQYEATGEAIKGFAGSTSEFWAQLSEEEQEALEKMIQTVDSFDGLFDTINTKSKATASEMAESLQHNADAMSDYADNVHTAMEIADNAEGETGEATRAIVNHLIGLGLDGAAELAEFVQAAQEDSDAYHEILANFGDFEAAQAEVEQALADWNMGWNTGYEETVRIATEKHTELKTEQEAYQTEAETSATTHKDEMVKIHQDSAVEQAQAIRDGTGEITDAIGEQIEAQKQAVEEGLDYDGTTAGYYKDVGTNSVQSWADAIKDNQDKVIDADQELIDELIQTTESTLQISGDHCGVSEGWGSALTSTLAQTIRSGSGEVASAVHELCEEACNSFDLSPLVNRIEGLIADGVGRAEAAIGGIMSSYGI